MLLALWMLWAPLASTSAAAPSSPCSAFGAGCASALAIAEASNSEEDEEEPEEGDEEAASAEAEAEEDGSGTAGSPSSHRSGSSSNRGSGSPSSPGSGPNVAVLSRLRLTARATSGLKRSKPSISTVAFSFTLSAPAKVRVTLVKQVSSHGHKRWTTLPNSLMVSVGRGLVSRSLTGRNSLSPGRYRLTAKPLTGRSRSIYLRARR
jgi:hypothetical protein